MDFERINQCINKIGNALVKAIEELRWAEVEVLSKILENLFAIRDRYYMTAPMQALSMRQSLEDIPMMGMED
jgi:hypothetical protein